MTNDSYEWQPGKVGRQSKKFLSVILQCPSTRISRHLQVEASRGKRILRDCMIHPQSSLGELLAAEEDFVFSSKLQTTF
ncbi:MAG: hypothetical protein KI793_01310 [Rivularia sp. (in: Bacteria)]|nr:hypothetical protein [Rivularia sp. MS3]